MFVLFGLAWFVGAIAVAGAAYDRGRNAFGWFLIAVLVLSPLFSLLFLAVLPDLRRERIEQERHIALLRALAAEPVEAAYAPAQTPGPELNAARLRISAAAILLVVAAAIAASYAGH